MKIKYLIILLGISFLSTGLLTKITNAQELSTPSAQTTASPTPTPSPGPSPQLASASTTSIYDANGDGIINLIDARIISPPTTANCPVCVDVNGDRAVDQKDVDLVNSHIIKNTDINSDNALPVAKPRFDINNNGTIDQNDVDIVKDYLGQGVSTPVFGLDDPSELIFGFIANQLLVTYKQGTTDTQKQALSSKYNLNLEKSFILAPQSVLSAGEGNVENLEKQIKNEAVVDKVYKAVLAELMTDDTNWVNQWGHQKIGIEYTWLTDTHGATGLYGYQSIPVRVGIIDSGADYTHADLQQNLSYRIRHNVNNNNYTTFQNDDVTDDNGHGTHMAGIIGATANNNRDIAGLNWSVELMPIKACYGSFGVCSAPNISAALEWISLLPDDQLPQVINMSVGIDSHDTDGPFDYYMDYLMDVKGVIFIVAAGNSGTDDCLYPANHGKAVCVGATDQNDALAVNSSGRRSADILAPGVDILSTTPPNSTIDTNHNGIQSLNPDNTVGGTSMATAYVTGVTALCLKVSPQPTRWNFMCDNYRNNGFGRIDSWATVWYKNCKRFDHNNNLYVGPGDLNDILNRMGKPYLYDIAYDVYPVGGDHMINAADYFVQNSMTGATCQ